jgi:hypothetical protein
VSTFDANPAAQSCCHEPLFGCRVLLCAGPNITNSTDNACVDPLQCAALAAEGELSVLSTYMHSAEHINALCQQARPPLRIFLASQSVSDGWISLTVYDYLELAYYVHGTAHEQPLLKACQFHSAPKRLLLATLMCCRLLCAHRPQGSYKSQPCHSQPGRGQAVGTMPARQFQETN